MTDVELREQFEEAFSDHVGSCVADCACGRIFYNPDGGWSWDDGELALLRANPQATAIDCSVGYVSFEGQTFVDACDCWWPRAKKIAEWILSHAHGIAAFINLDAKRQRRVAEAAPVVESADAS